MRVSVCVPVYGAEKYIERCAVSLFEQTYKDIEYIFVNDCTKDRSIEILREVIARYPERKDDVRIVHHDVNKGTASCRNTGVSCVTAGFLMHVDSDDWLSENAVELLVSEQKIKNYDIVIGCAKRYYNNRTDNIIYPRGITAKQLAIKMLSCECELYIWGRLIRTSLYHNYDIRALDGARLGEDIMVAPELVIHAKSVGVIPNYIYHYDCINESSLTRHFDEEKDRDRWRCVDALDKKVREFNDKDYEKAYHIGYLRILVRMLKSSARARAYDYYSELKLKQKSIDRSLWKYIPIYERLPLLTNSPRVVKFYVIMMGYLKRCLLKF